MSDTMIVLAIAAVLLLQKRAPIAPPPAQNLDLQHAAQLALDVATKAVDWYQTANPEPSPATWVDYSTAAPPAQGDYTAANDGTGAA